MEWPVLRARKNVRFSVRAETAEVTGTSRRGRRICSRRALGPVQRPLHRSLPDPRGKTVIGPSRVLANPPTLARTQRAEPPKFGHGKDHGGVMEIAAGIPQVLAA